MFDSIAIVLTVINTALLMFGFFRLQTRASKQDIINIIHLIRSGRAKILVENVEKIKKGNTKAYVEQLLGEADSPTNREWIYYLDEHSGYAIAFDSADCVEGVNAWRS